MLTDEQATEVLLVELPGIEVAAHAHFKELHLFRVVWPSSEEADYDPFFSVHAETGEVSEFSIMTDGDPSEIAAAFAANQGNP